LDELKERLYLLLVVLFGSYAKGNYTVASDVDLLVVYDGEKREDATKSLISCSRKASISVCQKPKVFEHGENAIKFLKNLRFLG